MEPASCTALRILELGAAGQRQHTCLAQKCPLFSKCPHLAAGVPAKLFLDPPHALACKHTRACAASVLETFPPAQLEKACSAQGCGGRTCGDRSVCEGLGLDVGPVLPPAERSPWFSSARRPRRGRYWLQRGRPWP